MSKSPIPSPRREDATPIEGLHIARQEEIKEESGSEVKMTTECSKKQKTDLDYTVDAYKLEITELLSELSENESIEEPTGDIIDKIKGFKIYLESLKKKKMDRVKQLIHEIYDLKYEISGIRCSVNSGGEGFKLEELKKELEVLKTEKEIRRKMLDEKLQNLSSFDEVLGCNIQARFSNPETVCDEVFSQLDRSLDILGETKKKRFEQIQELLTKLTKLWEVLEVPSNERVQYKDLLDSIGTKIQDVTKKDILTQNMIEKVKLQVFQLECFKQSKIKELEDIQKNIMQLRSEFEGSSSNSEKSDVFQGEFCLKRILEARLEFQELSNKKLRYALVSQESHNLALINDNREKTLHIERLEQELQGASKEASLGSFFETRSRELGDQNYAITSQNGLLTQQNFGLVNQVRVLSDQNSALNLEVRELREENNALRAQARRGV